VLFGRDICSAMDAAHGFEFFVGGHNLGMVALEACTFESPYGFNDGGYGKKVHEACPLWLEE